MPNIDPDKYGTLLQWLGLAGSLIGGTVIGIFGSRRSKRKPEVSEEDELDRLRRQADDEAVRRDLQLIIEAARQSLHGELEAARQTFYGELAKLGERLRQVEIAQAISGRGSQHRRRPEEE